MPGAGGRFAPREHESTTIPSCAGSHQPRVRTGHRFACSSAAWVLMPCWQFAGEKIQTWYFVFSPNIKLSAISNHPHISKKRKENNKKSPYQHKAGVKPAGLVQHCCHPPHRQDPRPLFSPHLSMALQPANPTPGMLHPADDLSG